MNPDLTDIPEDIISAAHKLHRYFAEHNIKTWRVGMCASVQQFDTTLVSMLESRVRPRLVELRNVYYNTYGRPQFAAKDFDDAVLAIDEVIEKLK